MKKIFFLVVIILLGVFQSCMNENEVETNDAQGNFDALWKIIDTRYCYLDYKNINWDSIYTVYHAKLSGIKTRYDLFDLLGDMLAELKDGHVNLYSGFDVSRYWKWYTDYPSNFDMDLIKSDRYLGENYRIAGSLYYNKIAGGKVGYVYYSSFNNSFNDSNISYIFDLFKDCQGLIIDVRDNGGGYVTYAETLASYFFKEKTLTGYITYKTGSGHSDFSDPVATYVEPSNILHWYRPVVILTNRLSYSATNDFVNIMSYAPYATIVGDKTGGGGGLPFSSELPNGWMVRFSTSPMLNAEKEDIEGGIEPHPDNRVDLDSADEVNGYDTIIETAISKITGTKTTK